MMECPSPTYYGSNGLVPEAIDHVLESSDGNDA